MSISRDNIISVTKKAAEHIKYLLDKASNKYQYIRVGVKSGGCSGFKYQIEYANEKNQYDEVVNSHDLTILIDPKALMYLIGSEMDYISDDFKSGFVFINPNEKGKCGCGSSFNV